MYLTSQVKKDIFKKHGGNEKNTGTSESQIALFTLRIDHLTGHLKSNKKDFGTQRALLNLVGKRRALLDYLKKTDLMRYRAIIKTLDIFFLSAYFSCFSTLVFVSIQISTFFPVSLNFLATSKDLFLYFVS